MAEDPSHALVLEGLLKSLLPDRACGQPGRLLQLPRPALDYGWALERSARNLRERQSALDGERAEAELLVPELLAHRAERRQLLVRNDPRFHTWGVLERLLEESRAGLVADAAESERLAALALAQADHLDRVYYGLSRLEDMRARAWSTTGEARRLRSDFLGAAEAFATAYAHLGAGTGDALEQALVLDAEAALLRCRRRFGAAKERLLQAIAIFLENDEEERVGLSLVTLAAVHRDQGHPARALPLLREAERRIDGGSEPRLRLAVQHGLVETLLAAGRLMEARGHLIRARPLYRQYPDGWTQSHLRWLRGRLAVGLAQAAEAEAELAGARAGFLAAGAAFEAALVALDLAALYARQQRDGELKRLAAEAGEVFAGCGVERESRLALSFLRQAEEIAGSRQELAGAAALGESGDRAARPTSARA